MIRTKIAKKIYTKNIPSKLDVYPNFNYTLYTYSPKYYGIYFFRLEKGFAKILFIGFFDLCPIIDSEKKIMISEKFCI